MLSTTIGPVKCGQNLMLLPKFERLGLPSTSDSKES
jgi:hypothetical protein